MAKPKELATGEANLLRLNLGAGDTDIPGYLPVDRKFGQEVYPLEYPNDAVDEIRASHVLEHFAHGEVSEVVNHWVDKLKPGGCLKIAVPDFHWIAAKYLKGEPIPLQGFLMGGQVDENDFHKCAFDRESLHKIMANAGLERIGPWDDGTQDCSMLPVSLNLCGWKPGAGKYTPGKTTAVLSAPRFAPTMHMQCSHRSFGQLRIPYRVVSGAYWHQVMSTVIDEQRHDCEYLITCDYDSIFTPQDVHELLRLMAAYPEVDAIFPIQMKRSDEAKVLASTQDEVYTAEFEERDIREMDSGHFGLTVFRTSAFETFPRPWFLGVPNEEGDWDEGKVDADIYFWRKWKQHGRTACIAPRVVIGHLQELIAWPNKQLTCTYQTLTDFNDVGIPSGVRR